MDVLLKDVKESYDLYSLNRDKAGNIVSESTELNFNEVLTGRVNNDIVSDLQSKYGIQISLASVEKNEVAIKKHAGGMGGFNNVTIAPNILEEMSENEETYEKIVGEIESFLNNIPIHKQKIRMGGSETIAMGMIVHEDGTVTHWSASRTKVDPADVKKEKEAKEKKKEQYEISLEIANERRMVQERNNEIYFMLNTMATQDASALTSTNFEKKVAILNNAMYNPNLMSKILNK